MTAAPARPPASRLTSGRPIADAVLAGTALLSALFAFVGLDAGSFWIDELFTLFLVDHDGGPAEVVRRALTDTSPPLYYILLHGWLGLFGLSEVSARLLSALLAVSAVATVYAGTAGHFSRTARLFAAAMATTSVFWFEQSQNARTYSLCLMISAGLLVLALAIHRRGRQPDARFPLGLWLALTALGALGCFAHFYVFLEVGLIYLVLLLTLPRNSWRAAVVAAGLLALAGTVAYVLTLLGATKQNLQNLWFRNDVLFFLEELWRAAKSVLGIVSVVTVAALLGLALRRPQSLPADPERRWLLGLSAFVLLGLIVLGIAVSLSIAPSFSARNVLVAAPFLWVLLAGLWDAGRPAGDTRGGAALTLLLVALVAVHASMLRTRLMPRNEDWRASASLVQSFPACAGQTIPVVLPFLFGPSTPYFRKLAERWFFGRYFPDHGRLRAYLPEELAGREPVPPGLGDDVTGLIVRRATDPQGCPVLAWGVHDLSPERADALGQEIEQLPGMMGVRVEVRRFEFFRPQRLGIKTKAGAFVYLARPV